MLMKRSFARTSSFLTSSPYGDGMKLMQYSGKTQSYLDIGVSSGSEELEIEILQVNREI